MLFFVLCKFVLSTHEMLSDWMHVTYLGTQEEQALTIKRLEAYKLYVQSFLFTKEWAKIINDKFTEITSSQAEQMDSLDFKTNVLVLTESLVKIITRAKTVDSLFKSNDSHGMKEAALRLNSDDFENITLTFDNEFLKEVFVPLTAKFSNPNNFSGNPEQEVSFMKDLFIDLGLDKISVFVKTFIKELAKNDSTSSEDVNEAKSAPILPAENPSLGD